MLTNTQDHAVAVSVQVPFPVLRADHHVVEHLRAFGMLYFRVLFGAHRLSEVLMNQLSHLLPGRVVVHPQDMVSFSNHPLTNFICGPITGDSLQGKGKRVSMCLRHP